MTALASVGSSAASPPVVLWRRVRGLPRRPSRGRGLTGHTTHGSQVPWQHDEGALHRPNGRLDEWSRPSFRHGRPHRDQAVGVRGSKPRVARWLRVIGPAWVVMLADVDAPSIITSGRAGTEFGYTLILPLLAMIPVLYLVQEMTARLGILTRRGHAELIRERYGTRLAALVVTMVLIDLVAYVAEFAGIALGATMVGVPVPGDRRHARGRFADRADRQ